MFVKNKKTIKAKRKSFAKYSFLLFFALFSALQLFAPTKAEAHTSYFMDFRYDPSGRYISVQYQKDGTTVRGCKHTGPIRGPFHMVNEDVSLGQSVVEKNQKETCKGSNADPYSFPAHELFRTKFFGDYTKTTTGNATADTVLGGLFRDNVNDATSADFNRAKLIGSNLTKDLNSTVDLIYGSNNLKTWESNAESMRLIAKSAEAGAKSATTVTIGGKPVTFSPAKDIKPNPSNGTTALDFVTVSVGGKSQTVQYRMLKGYVKVDGYNFDHESLTDIPLSNYSSDVAFINWSMLVYQADYNYIIHRYNSNTVAQDTEQSLFTKMIVDFIEDIILSLTGMLGLYSLWELIYNGGVRSTNYHYGVFADSWKPIIDQFYLIFMFFGVSVLMFAMLKLLFQKTMSTMNSQMRVSLIDGILQFLIAIAMIMLFPLVIDFAFKINHVIVNIFSNSEINLDELERASNFGMIGGAIYAVFYFIVLVRLNIMYIMRGLFIGILIVAAPAFISSLAMGGKFKDMFGQYARELFGNIFMQAFQAFVITFLFTAVQTSRTIEMVVVLMMFFTLNEFFRSAVFGSGGGTVNNMGGKMASTALSAGADSVGNLARGMGRSASRGMAKGKGKGNKEHDSKGGSKESSETTSTAQSSRFNQGGEGAGGAGKTDSGATKEKDTLSERGFIRKAQSKVSSAMSSPKGSAAKGALVGAILTATAMTAKGIGKTGMAMGVGDADPSAMSTGNGKSGGGRGKGPNHQHNDENEQEFGPNNFNHSPIPQHDEPNDNPQDNDEEMEQPFVRSFAPEQSTNGDGIGQAQEFKRSSMEKQGIVNMSSNNNTVFTRFDTNRMKPKEANQLHAAYKHWSTPEGKKEMMGNGITEMKRDGNKYSIGQNKSMANVKNVSRSGQDYVVERYNKDKNIELGLNRIYGQSPNPDPSPEPSPNPDPSPEPSPNPDPSPEPSPNPDPSPDPSPGPNPQRKPIPTPTPNPSPEPSPEPEDNEDKDNERR